MTASPLRISRHQEVLNLTLARPEKANALNARMMRELGAAAAEARAGDILVLRSASPTLFCAGADLGEFSAGGRQQEEQEHALLDMIERLAARRAPLLAIARGRASGAGAILLSLADLVIAADDLQIACPEIRFGMYPIIVEAVLQTRMAPALAARLCLNGQALAAPQAYDLGLATEVLPAAGFEAAAERRLDFYLERASALHIARRSRLIEQPAQVLMQKMRAVAPLMAENFASAGVQARMQSYLEGLRRRPPESD